MVAPEHTLEPTLRSTLHPDGDADARAELDAQFLNGRREFALETIHACRAHVGAAAEQHLVEAISTRADLLVDPVFTIWVRVLAQANGQRRDDLVGQHVAQLSRVLSRVDQRLSGRDARYVAGTAISVQRDDLDPYVMAVTPPSYDFTAPRSSDAGHTVALHAELVGLALSNIRAAWPEEFTEICELVQIVGYLPDAPFTSCSAARYAGVVYLGNADESILDIEEALVHEAGHQRLYRVGEVTQLTTPDASKTDDFVLPWSGSERDLFGFLHACYIYVLLVKYFLRRRRVDDGQASDCQRRAELIFLGLMMAMPDLKRADHLSESGRQLVAALEQDLDALRAMVLD